MVFKIKLLLSAQKDLEEAIEYYNQVNNKLSLKFYSEFLELNNLLEKNPFFEIRYNEIRTYNLKSFPYVVHFIINENLNLVIILAIVFGKMEKNKFQNRIPNYNI